MIPCELHSIPDLRGYSCSPLQDNPGYGAQSKRLGVRALIPADPLNALR